MNLSAIEVYKSPYPKKRYGNKLGDGGYVICEEPVGSYDCLLACGVGGDVSFEEEFLEKYQNIPAFAFDGTMDAKFPKSEKITFVNKNVGTVNTERETNLSEYFEKYDNIFVKMDIEGWEFPWLHSLNVAQLRKIRQFVVEFHHSLSDVMKWKALEKIASTHWLVHLHSHNGTGKVTTTYNKEGKEYPLIIPNLMENTYIRKEFLPLSDEPIPGPLDMRNSPEVEDPMPLKGYPYNTLI